MTLTKASVLRGTKWNFPFHIHTNAYEISIGVVLEKKEVNKEYFIYYISKNL
jgi:hypothetical protein